MGYPIGQARAPAHRAQVRRTSPAGWVLVPVNLSNVMDTTSGRVHLVGKVPFTMRPTILFFLLALITAVPLRAVDLPTAPAAADAQVVVHITDLDDAMLAKLAVQVGKDRRTTLEYSCVWSGVVVLKFSDVSVTERADAITMARRLLGEAGIEQGVEFLHVTVEAKGPGKC